MDARRERPARFDLSSIRVQWRVLFGLMLATLAVVLALDEWAHARTLRTLRQLQHDALVRVRTDQALSEIYRFDIAETAVRVYAGRL
ncbi:MAG TPA: hypothetical protein VIG68_07990, partial [Lysobacter sp.]